MDNYHIAPIGTGFQVIEALPDGNHRSVGGFSTADEASAWLDSFLILMGLIDFMPRKDCHERASCVAFNLSEWPNMGGSRVCSRAVQPTHT